VGDLEGCGDHSCIIAKPRGMGTNGGCRCLKEMSFETRVRVGKAIQTLKALAGINGNG
jgi:hypothetical protein